MLKLTNKDIQNRLFLRGLENVIQRGIRTIKEQNSGKTEKEIPELKQQRVLMQKFYFALLYDRIKVTFDLMD